MTVLPLARKAPSDVTKTATFRVTSTPIGVREALNSVLRHPLMTQLSDDARGTTEVVLAEALNNIVEHAYYGADGWIELRLTWRPRQLHCDVLDTGVPMPNNDLPEGLAQSVGDHKDLPEGGFGWFLIRHLTENLNYRRINACNHLSFQLKTEQ